MPKKNNSSQKKFLLIDGSSLIFRAFYAIRNLTTKDGIYTNGVYGFLMMYFKALELIKPDYVAVAFDKKGPTFRVKDYEAYKGNRQETPNELQAQFGILKDVLDLMGIKHLEMDQFEADDIVGTLAKRGSEEGIYNYLLTGDRDYFQLVDKNTCVLFTKKGISELETVDEEWILNKYGLKPEQLIEVKGLQGDASDNIPGVPGVGEKTALKLIKEYENLEGVYEHISEISGAKLKQNLEENELQAIMSRKLGTIFREVPIEDNPEKYIPAGMDKDALRERFQILEFNSFKEKLNLEDEVKKVNTFEISCLDEDSWAAYAKECLAGEKIFFAVLGNKENYIHAEPCYLIAKIEQKDSVLISIVDNEEKFKEIFSDVFLSENVKKVAYDVKESIVLLYKLGIEISSNYEDLMLMEYLINPNRTGYDISKLGADFTNSAMKSKEEFLGKGKQRREFNEVEIDELSNYASAYLNIMENSEKKLTDRLSELGMLKLFCDIENPLAKVLANMEIAGIQVRTDELKRLGNIFSSKLIEIEKNIHDHAGRAFNINSPKQLGDVLFNDLELPHGKKTKTGYSTNAEVLEKLKNAHPIVKGVLDYRALSKLMSTYIDGMKPYIDDDERIRSIFKQNVAATGRLSSTEPNLQNIPVRTEDGRKLRAVFAAKKGYVLVDADYSQIELRILACLSGDRNMQNAFLEGEDIHRKTAAEVNHVDFEDVTDLQRSRAKAVNFGIIYGISDYGLSQDLGISREEAKEYIEGYKNTYPSIKKYMDDVVKSAKKTGYVDTYYGRRRDIPELMSNNFNIRSFGERIALNTPIQGTAADIIKIAMIRVDRELKNQGFEARMILQVHDELIIEAPENEAEKVKNLVSDIMEGVGEFEVPLIADAKIGKSWFDAK